MSCGRLGSRLGHRDKNDSKSGLASPDNGANLSQLILDRIEADFASKPCKHMYILNNKWLCCSIFQNLQYLQTLKPSRDFLVGVPRLCPIEIPICTAPKSTFAEYCIILQKSRGTLLAFAECYRMIAKSRLLKSIYFDLYRRLSKVLEIQFDYLRSVTFLKNSRKNEESEAILPNLAEAK